LVAAASTKTVKAAAEKLINLVTFVSSSFGRADFLSHICRYADGAELVPND
jgi:hypothetical protein